jgi:DNA-binding transcriptional regulator YhcF (GntR family)
MGKFWIENSIYDDGWLKKLSGSQLKVLLSITRHYDKYGKCFPSIRKLEENINLHHATIKECLNKLELLGFLEQLVIKERCKLRYIFSKTAHKIFLEPNKLLAKPDSKEVIKESIKEENFYSKNNKRTPEEQEHLNKTLAEMKKKLASKFKI